MHRINKQHSTNSMETSDLLKRVRQIEKNAMDKIKEAMLANTHLQLD